jgi:hypothetical protein
MKSLLVVVLLALLVFAAPVAAQENEVCFESTVQTEGLELPYVLVLNLGFLAIGSLGTIALKTFSPFAEKGANQLIEVVESRLDTLTAPFGIDVDWRFELEKQAQLAVDAAKTEWNGGKRTDFIRAAEKHFLEVLKSPYFGKVYEVTGDQLPAVFRAILETILRETVDELFGEPKA